MTSKAFELMPRAAQEFADRVHQIADPDTWEAETPDDEWTVRDLVNHVTVEQLWAPHLLRGETIRQVGDRYDGDQLGEEPVVTWDRAIEDALSSWSDTDPDEIVHLSFGDVPAAVYAEQMLADLVVHAWDLAKGADLDDRLDPELVAFCLVGVEANKDMLAASGLFGTPGETDSDDPQDQLLVALGRTP